MLKWTFKILLLLFVLTLSACKTTKTVEGAIPDANLIIYYEPEAGSKDLLKAAKIYGSEVLYVYKNFNGIAVTVPKNKSVDDAIKYYEGIKGVLSVAKDRKLQLD